MPYSDINDMDLPKYVKELSPKQRARWIAIFNRVMKTHHDNEEAAFRIANGTVLDSNKRKS
jgi:ABC-type transporter MlaC component